MSQQLFICSVSPFLLQQIELEGVVALEIFEEADEDFELDDYVDDLELEFSENLRPNINTIVQEGVACNAQETIEIQGSFADAIHMLLIGNTDADTLTGRTIPDTLVTEEFVNDKTWQLANALVGLNKVTDADDYVASYLLPHEVQQISVALNTISHDDLNERIEALGLNDLNLSNAERAEAKEFISEELQSIYATATDKGYGILISWSI